jgi:hypothetical protein
MAGLREINMGDAHRKPSVFLRRRRGSRLAKIAGWLLASMLAARTSSAQSSAEPPAVAPAAEHALRMPAIVWAAAVAADQITTYRFSSQYSGVIREENPLLRGLDRHPALLVATGGAIDAASGWLSYRLLHEHPRLAQLAFYGAAAYRAYLAGHNIEMMRQADALRAQALAGR